MLLLAHIVVALLSIGYVAYLYIAPSQTKLRITYSLEALTLTSGVLLISLNPAHAASAVVSGTIYLTIITISTVLARKKLSSVVSSQ